MARYLLHHRHQPHECGIVFASGTGGHSPPRHHARVASCPSGGHQIRWTAGEAGADAPGLLPFYSAQPRSPASLPGKMIVSLDGSGR